MGRIAERRNRFEEAVAAYHRAVTIDPRHRDAHYNLAFLHQQTGNVDQAIEHFQAVTQLDPQNPEAHLNLGVLLAGNGQIEQAEHEYLTALDLDPNLAETYYNLGIFYEFHKQDLDQALQYYREYLERGGEDERIRRLVDDLGR